ncbi:2TM domain-containing protein [Flavobacterium sp. 3HN19-14]|uniref:2TM domain-containing protein n=1 Tax=Flavobacterium sp. 3HN19-14 TaxID=3448133 RepID=UPI003EE023B7
MQTFIRYIFKAILRGIFISAVIAAVLIFIEIVYGRKVIFNQEFLEELGYYCLYGVTLTLVNSAFFQYLNRKVVWEKYSKYRILIGAAGSISLTMAGIFFIRMFVDTVLHGHDITAFLYGERFEYYVVSLIITLVISLFFHAVYFYKSAQEKKVKEQKIIAGTASAQFESLKNQIDPHFLFNSLNVLSSLIEENPENAQRFTTSLSKIYRYVLEQKDKDLVSVEEEMSFAKTYMNLLKMRFENSVFYELPEKLENPEAKVVPLSMQLLLENTVKHNVASESKPLYIRIFERGDYLVIENDFQKKEVLQDRKGVGLQNIINRYSIMTRRKVQIEQTDKIFSVALPMLTKQIAIMETQFNDQESIYIKAQKRVDDIKGFYGNLISYIVFTIAFAILNLTTSPEYLWFLWPGLGWGFGVVVHGITVFNLVPFLGRDWEDKKIRELMEKHKSDKWQ